MPAQRKQMSLKEMETRAKAACHEWNEKYPDGVLVSFEEIIGRGETHRGHAGKAMVQSCEAVVFIQGKAGFVSLEHCTPIEEQAAGTEVQHAQQ